MTDEERDIELLAASLRADASDLSAFVEALATKLEGALMERVKVVRKRVSLLSSRKRVQTITIDLGAHEYVLAWDGSRVETRVGKATRGITLKTELLDLEQWIESLARAIDAEARDSERGRLALQRLLGVGP